MTQADPRSSKEQRSHDDEQETQKQPATPSRRITSTLERGVPTAEDVADLERMSNTHIEDHETAILASAPLLEEVAPSSAEQMSAYDERTGETEEASNESSEEESAFNLEETDRAFLEAIETSKLLSVPGHSAPYAFESSQSLPAQTERATDEQRDARDAVSFVPSLPAIDSIDTIDTVGILEAVEVSKTSVAPPPLPTLPKLPENRPAVVSRAARTTQQARLHRGGILLLIALLFVVVLHTTMLGSGQFLGSQGWAYVLGGPTSANDPNLLKNINNAAHQKPTPGATARTTPLTPQQYIDLIVQHMTLDQKLGQMLIVQFTGPAYSLDLSTMISQYGVGAVLIFSANQNIHDKAQLKDLIQQMQHNSTLPLAVAIDQEGGYVDRLVSLDGPRPSEATIGATNNPNKAQAAGIQDAQDLSSYGFNLNLAPVVDVTNAYNPQLYTRTYGNTPALVTKMAMAYLQGLQQSGKVLGTLKHFPGLGDVVVDPHLGVPHLSRSLSDLERIDWSPYRTLIQQGNIHAIMVTHEIVEAVDSNVPSSLSYKVVTGILRQQLGFQGVIMTDSLTMDSITAYYTEAQAAAVAVEAGSDLLMGAATPSDVASMIQGMKQAMSNGDISQQRIDDSVRRILMMKYAMGLLPIPNN